MIPTATITVTANGRAWQCAEGETLPNFLKRLGQTTGRVVVEYNQQPLSPAELEHIQLKDGDSLEIVRIVAGG